MPLRHVDIATHRRTGPVDLILQPLVTRPRDDNNDNQWLWEPLFDPFGRTFAVDRSAHSKALKDMVRQARARHAEGRQILIFPEGTRAPVGAPADYKPGIAALYRDLEADCTPMATNSGVHWPAHGFLRRPGVIVFEFLEPIPAGLKRGEFMKQLQERIETATTALLAEGL